MTLPMDKEEMNVNFTFEVNYSALKRSYYGLKPKRGELSLTHSQGKGLSL